MSPTRVLLLAGTAEAAQLAHLLAAQPGIDVVASLAGRTSAPAPLPCPVRTGGFGGVDGLVDELRRGGYDLLVDATHPFAAAMAHHACAAAAFAGIPRLRLLRPPWRAGPGDDWDEVETLDAAACRLVEIGARRVLLTTGRELAPFAPLAGTHFAVRTIEPPGPLPLADAQAVVARPPFTVDAESELLRSQRIDTLVTKNSGGGAAKLVAARQERVKVVMVQRPPGVGPHVATAPQALRWVDLMAKGGGRS
ncbi:MAG: cobalt-precorrin-6A reductase [Actinomycetota bacterium]